jgi:hypothetical protein
MRLCNRQEPTSFAVFTAVTSSISTRGRYDEAGASHDRKNEINPNVESPALSSRS